MARARVCGPSHNGSPAPDQRMRMTRWFRTYWDEEDRWLYVEVSDDGIVTRQVEFTGPDQVPTSAASLTESTQPFAAGGIAHSFARSGGVADQPSSEWADFEREELTLEQFDQAWDKVRLG